jgi:hypothetical protein
MAAAPFLIAATAVQAIGAISSANAQAGAYNNQAAASRYNAEVSRQQADQALQVSAAQQMQQRRQARQVLGLQRAGAAESGVGMGGSNADLLERSETLAELDALNLAYEGTLRARGYTTQAELDEFQARAFDAQAKSTKRAGYLSAAGSILGGAYTLSGGVAPKTGATPKSTVGSSGGYFGGIRPGASQGFRVRYG